jgi:hypothetical protein
LATKHLFIFFEHYRTAKLNPQFHTIIFTILQMTQKGTHEVVIMSEYCSCS